MADTPKVYRVHWSEGEPVVITASSFARAIDAFRAWITADGLSTAEQAIDWIESIEKLSDEEIVEGA